MHRVLTLSAMMVLISIFCMSPAAAGASTKTKLRSQKYCPDQLRVCLTLPQIGPKTSKTVDGAGLYVENYFLGNKSCINCSPADATGYTSYALSVYRMPVNELVNRVFKTKMASGGWCAGDGDIVSRRQVKIDSVSARSAICRTSYAYNHKITQTSMAVIWWYREFSYFMELVRAGKHPPAEWSRVMKSIRFKR